RVHRGLRRVCRPHASQLLALSHHGVDGPVDVLTASALRWAMVASARFAAFSNAATTSLILFALASAVPSAMKLVNSSRPRRRAIVQSSVTYTLGASPPP